jgi:hypothetical protein
MPMGSMTTAILRDSVREIKLIQESIKIDIAAMRETQKEVAASLRALREQLATIKKDK